MEKKEPSKAAKFFGIIIMICIIGLPIYLISTCSTGKSNQLAVQQSEYDGSVYQVERFVKNNLKDPDSYEGVSWSKMMKYKDSDTSSAWYYQIRHTYRAKNSFGGYVVESKVFKLDSLGNIFSVED